MNRFEYFNDPNVRGFIAWVTPLVIGKRPFIHQWHSPKWGPWSCESLFGAYLSFKWRFSVTRPGEAEPTRGKSFEENADTLDLLSRMLRDSAERGDADTFLDAAIAVVEWGGVRRNKVRLNALGKTALPTICAAAEQLDPERADWARLDLVRDMNSGFSKIYSLMLDGFPIYDSRVACALCSLIRAYCKESGLATVPPLLSLGLPPSQGRLQRNPSVRELNFHQLWHGQRWKYAVSNLMAAWLLGPMSELGPFAELPIERRLLAVESALFMIGYSKVKL